MTADLRMCDDLEQRAMVAEARVAELEAQLDAMKEALKFYADPLTWQLDGAAPISTAPIRADRGDRARSALAKLEKANG